MLEFCVPFVCVPYPRLTSLQRRAGLVFLWNIASQETRGFALSALVALVRGHDADTEAATGSSPIKVRVLHVTFAIFCLKPRPQPLEVDSGFLTELPAEFFSEVPVPDAWFGQFSAMSPSAQVDVLVSGWRLCSVSDQRMILGDMEHYFGLQL